MNKNSKRFERVRVVFRLRIVLCFATCLLLLCLGATFRLRRITVSYNDTIVMREINFLPPWRHAVRRWDAFNNCYIVVQMGRGREVFQGISYPADRVGNRWTIFEWHDYFCYGLLPSASERIKVPPSRAAPLLALTGRD